MKKALNNLTKAYHKGKINYPRVSNSYKKDKSFFAHAPLQEFDKYSTPLGWAKRLLDRVSLPIYLINKNITTASTVVGTIETIKKYFKVENDKPIRAKKDKEQELLALRDKFFNFIKAKFKIEKIKDFISYMNKVLHIEREAKVFLYQVDIKTKTYKQGKLSKLRKQGSSIKNFLKRVFVKKEEKLSIDNFLEEALKIMEVEKNELKGTATMARKQTQGNIEDRQRVEKKKSTLSRQRPKT